MTKEPNRAVLNKDSLRVEIVGVKWWPILKFGAVIWIVICSALTCAGCAAFESPECYPCRIYEYNDGHPFLMSWGDDWWQVGDIDVIRDDACTDCGLPMPPGMIAAAEWFRLPPAVDTTRWDDTTWIIITTKQDATP